MSSTVVYRFSPDAYCDIAGGMAKQGRLGELSTHAARDFEMTQTSVLGKLSTRTVTRHRPTVSLLLEQGQPMFNNAEHDVIVVVSCCAQDATVAVTLNLCLSQATADQLVAIGHSTSGRAAKTPIVQLALEGSDGAPVHAARSILGAQQQIAEYLGITGRPSASSHFRCVEIRQIGNVTTAEEAMERNLLALYGVLVADEGWRHVGAEVARHRFARRWGTRRFVGIMSIGDATLSLNFRPTTYSVAQNAFFERHFAHVEPYFSNEYCVAGLEHGPFLARELTAYRQCVVEDLQNRLQSRRALKLTVSLLGDVRDRARRNSLYRSLVEDMVRLRDHPPTELGALVTLIEEDSELPQSMDNLRQEVQALESEEQILYLYRVNRLLVVVAWIGVALAIGGLVAASGIVG